MNRKKQSILATLFCMMCVVYAEVSITQLTGAQLETLMTDKTEKSKYLVIDVREKEEYAEGHVRNAINLSVNEIQYRLAEISDLKNKNIVTICRSGARSMRAAEMLKKEGFTRLFNAPGVCSYAYQMNKTANIRGQKLQELAEAGTYLIIDVREAKDYAAGHIKGAVNIPAAQLDSKIKELPKAKKIAVYCYTGEKSFAAAQKLSAAGYDALNVLDGTKEYKGYSLVK